MIKILLVEDDDSLGATLKERLEKETYEVRWAQSLKEARVEIEEFSPQLILLDVGLPDGSGFDLAKEVRTQRQTPFLFITAQTTAEDRLTGYEIGAEEYIPKPFHLKELLLRVKNVLDRSSAVDQLRLKTVIVDFPQMAIVKNSGEVQRLPSKDFSILSYLIEKSPAVVSRDEIIEKFWGADAQTTNRTIDNVIVRLRQALGDTDGQAIQSVRGVGYQWILKD